MALSELSRQQIIQKRQKCAVDKSVYKPMKTTAQKPKKESLFAPDESEAIANENT